MNSPITSPMARSCTYSTLLVTTEVSFALSSHPHYTSQALKVFANLTVNTALSLFQSRRHPTFQSIVRSNDSKEQRTILRAGSFDAARCEAAALLPTSVSLGFQTKSQSSQSCTNIGWNMKLSLPVSFVSKVDTSHRRIDLQNQVPFLSMSQ